MCRGCVRASACSYTCVITRCDFLALAVVLRFWLAAVLLIFLRLVALIIIIIIDFISTIVGALGQVAKDARCVGWDGSNLVTREDGAVASTLGRVAENRCG